ncbi:MAG: hypothetical protein JKX93_05775 [Rhizobiaceae bacterium]|nr:hypothetical protein [Rhizobiaceae bacterium]MBL4695884.1 hypothetical protein [Rhizobiaceae bacterium]
MFVLTAYPHYRSGLRMGGTLVPGSHARPLGSHSFPMHKFLQIVPLLASHRIRPPIGGERRATGANAPRLRRPERSEDTP